MNKNKLPLVIIGCVAIAAIALFVIFWKSPKTDSAPKNTTAAANKAASNTGGKGFNALANAPAGAQPVWSRGPATAPVTIEEFADFECPSCAHFEPFLQEIKTVYGDKVRVVFRHFPLPANVHPKAYDAARAAEAAGMQNKFWEMHDLLFARQRDWTVSPDHRAEYAKYAQQIGLDVEKFKTDMAGMMTASRVDADKKRGEAIPIGSTPSAFLNGRPLDFRTEMSSAEALRRAVEGALQGK
jgi:protein-disulfide isomerase